MPIPRKQFEAEKVILDNFIVLADKLLAKVRPNSKLVFNSDELVLFKTAYDRLERETRRKAKSGPMKFTEDEIQKRVDERMKAFEIYRLIDEGTAPRMSRYWIEQFSDGLEVIRGIRQKAVKMAPNTKKAREVLQTQYEQGGTGWEEIAKVRAGNAVVMVEKRPEDAPAKGGRKGAEARWTKNKKKK
jgi:hypothetical protein